MCEPFACIVTKGRKVLIHETHSHEYIVRKYNLKDDACINRYWVRIEIRPYDIDYTSEVDTWMFVVDEEDTLPEWFTLDREYYEDLCRKEVRKWKEKFLKITNEDEHVVVSFEKGKIYYLDGQIHRDDGPDHDIFNVRLKKLTISK